MRDDPDDVDVAGVDGHGSEDGIIPSAMLRMLFERRASGEIKLKASRMSLT